MKKIKNWLIGLAMVSLPAVGYFAPAYIPIIPVAQDVLEYVIGDNGTVVVRQWTE
jgi:hypothetical protein